MKVIVGGGEKKGNFVDLKEYREWKRKKKEAEEIRRNPQGNVYAFPIVILSEPKICTCGEATRESVCPVCGKDLCMI